LRKWRADFEEKMRLLTWTLGGLVASSAIIGCGGTGTVFNTSAVQNLEPLKNGFLYEGWGMVNGSPVSFGKFNVNAEGKIVTPEGFLKPTFNLPSSLKNATKLIITVEPAVDPDAGPSTTKLLAGDVVGGQATLTTNHADALNTSFASASGNFLFATPTEQPRGTNPLSGLWFMNGPGLAGLTLPTLPAGWKYEGWVVVGGRPLSTGTFTSVNGADSSGTFSGPNAGPPFPGEDFLTNAPAGLTFPTNLTSSLVVVSVEPSPDDDPAPFSLKPLRGTAPAGAVAMTPYPLANLSSSGAPSMTIQVF
jgi:hypothetical protein